MFRPEAVPAGWRGAILACVLSLAVVALDSLSGVCALPLQSAPSSEAATAYPDGDGDSAAAAYVDAGRYPYADHTYGDGTYGPEQRAQELYLDGMDKLGGGHREWAQETFESVIARFPDSAAAGLARQRLGDLYRGTPPPSATAAVSNPVPAPLSARVAVVSPPASAPGRGPIWEQELRRNAPIQAKLRGEAGDRIFFSSGSAELGTRARMALAAQAQWLIRWHEFEAAVEGHADEPGTEEENVALSRERAEAVRQRLIEEGVEASRISIVAAGRTQRMATCTTPDCTSQNRRAVTLVFAIGTRARLGLAGPATPELTQTKSVQTPPPALQAGVTR